MSFIFRRGSTKLQEQKAREESQARSAELRKALNPFIQFCNRTLEKQDFDVDWLDYAKTYYDMFYQIATRFPEVETISDWHVSEIGPVRSYSWMDECGDWHTWDYETMLEHQKTFIDHNVWEWYIKRYAEKYPEKTLTLEAIGMSGGSWFWPMESVAYLSMAYFTKNWTLEILRRLSTF